MAGTLDGGRRAAMTNKAKYGSDFYARIGAIGGKRGHTGGFAARMWCDAPCPYDALWGDHKINQCAGARGGHKSKRSKV